jgi:hypothetical protein
LSGGLKIVYAFSSICGLIGCSGLKLKNEGGERDMRMKSFIALLVAMVFTFGMVSFTFAAEVKGTVTKVEAKSITVKDSAGKETKCDVSNPSDVKVGDMVDVKDGKAAKTKKSSSGGY